LWYYFLKNLHIGSKDVGTLTYRKCFKYVKLKPFYKELYLHNDFADGEDYVSYKGGLTIKEQKNFDISVEGNTSHSPKIIIYSKKR
jgi:hypothetical protein